MSDDKLELKDCKVIVAFTNKDHDYAQWVIEKTTVGLQSESLRKVLREIQEEGVAYLVEYLNVLEILSELNSLPTENLVASVNLRKFKNPEEKKKSNPKNSTPYKQFTAPPPPKGALGSLGDPWDTPESRKQLEEMKKLFEYERKQQERRLREENNKIRKNSVREYLENLEDEQEKKFKKAMKPR
jgi:hypothetical protein